MFLSFPFCDILQGPKRSRTVLALAKELSYVNPPSGPTSPCKDRPRRTRLRQAWDLAPWLAWVLDYPLDLSAHSAPQRDSNITCNINQNWWAELILTFDIPLRLSMLGEVVGVTHRMVMEGSQE
jgi:hypothetical protein